MSNELSSTIAGEAPISLQELTRQCPSIESATVSRQTFKSSGHTFCVARLYQCQTCFANFTQATQHRCNAKSAFSGAAIRISKHAESITPYYSQVAHSLLGANKAKTLDVRKMSSDTAKFAAIIDKYLVEKPSSFTKTQQAVMIASAFNYGTHAPNTTNEASNSTRPEFSANNIEKLL